MTLCRLPFSILAIVVGLSLNPSSHQPLNAQPLSAQDDSSQRLLPLPDRGVTDLPQHLEMLKRLRSLIDSQQNATPPQTPPSKDSKASKNALPENLSPENKAQEGPIQPQQFQQLQEALKKLTDKLPPGFVPPNLGDIPPEQLQKAMENPAVQKQMREMLQQFSKDGMLPKPDPDSNGPSLPIPPSPSARSDRNANNTPDNSSDDAAKDAAEETGPGQRSASDDGKADSKRSNGSSNDSNDDDSGSGSSPPDEPASQNPQGSLKSLRDFLKKLYDGSTTKPPGEADSPSQNGVAESGSSEPGDPVDEPVKPRQPLRRRDRQKGLSAPKPNPPGSNPAINSDDPSPMPQLDSSGAVESPRDAADGFPATDSPPSVLPRGDSPLPDLPGSPVPDNLRGGPGLNSPPRVDSPGLVPNDRQPNRKPNERGNMNPASPDLAESSQEQIRELQKTIEKLRALSEKAAENNSDPAASGNSASGNRSRPNPVPGSDPASPVMPSDPRNSDSPSRVPRLQNPSGSPNSKGVNPPGSDDSMPDVSEFLKEQLRNFKPPQNGSADSRAAEGSSSGQSQPRRDPSRNPAQNMPVPSEPASPLTPPERPAVQPPANPSARSMDIQKELERRGFGETLKKIVEKATKEGRQPKEPADGTPGQPGTSPQQSQLSESMAKMLDGLKDDLVEIAKDANFKDPSERPVRSRNSPREDSGSSNSMMDSFRKSASEILAGPSSRNADRSSGAASSASGSSLSASQFDFTPVAILAGLLAAASLGFLGLRYLKLNTSDVSALQFAGAPIRPAEIQNREDVVRAFHQFAMRSTRSVQSWWTHRTVQRVLAAATPEKQAAVETLANAYEQARYMPQDQDLSADQIQSARNAFQQCTT